MDKKSKIEFLNNGTEVVIIFPNGGKSIEFTSKKDAFEGITDMEKKKKITPEEFTKFRDAILAKNELPWSDEPGKIRIMHVVGPFMAPSLLGLLMSNAFGEDSEEKEETYFKMCNEDHGHVRIAGQGFITNPIFSKFDGIRLIKGLEDNKRISKEDFEKLSNEIENSPLPVNKESNKKSTNVN